MHGDGEQPQRHQVFELPEVKPHVTEYRIHSGCCERCRRTTRASLPQGVPNSAFGVTVLAVLGVLAGRCRLSKRAASEALQSLFGLTMSVGAVVNCQGRLSAALAAPVAEGSDHVQQQQIKNADETSWRQCNQRAWLCIFARTVSKWYEAVAKRAGVVEPKTGGLHFPQRFGGSLNLSMLSRSAVLSAVSPHDHDRIVRPLRVFRLVL